MKIMLGSYQMLLFLLSVFTVTLAYPPNIDPAIKNVFGTPGGTKPADITVRPTAGGTVLVDDDGVECKCVPYHLCDKDLNGINMNNRTVTGYGTLDIRFGGRRKCNVSVELCCTIPKPEPETEVPETVTHNPTTVRGCGYRNPHGIDFSVTGGDGNEAEYGEFPWVVALFDATDLSYIGVGVLIHPQVVMTGAHIVTNIKSGRVLARAGEWDTRTTEERLKHQERIGIDVVKRDDFAPGSLHNNIALILVEKPFDLAEHIGTLCLPDTDEDFDSYKNCVANGWGKEQFGKTDKYAVILKKVELNMVPFNTCSNLLKKTRLGYYFKLDESFICALGEKGEDTCQGDGGAPLACPTGDNRYKLAGLVSWGIGCDENNPGVYARVSKFRGWIDDVMANWGYTTN